MQQFWSYLGELHNLLLFNEYDDEQFFMWWKKSLCDFKKLVFQQLQDASQKKVSFSSFLCKNSIKGQFSSVPSFSSNWGSPAHQYAIYFRKKTHACWKILTWLSDFFNNPFLNENVKHVCGRIPSQILAIITIKWTGITNCCKSYSQFRQLFGVWQHCEQLSI